MSKRIEDNVLAFSDTGPFGSAHMGRPFGPADVYRLVREEGSGLPNLWKRKAISEFVKSPSSQVNLSEGITLIHSTTELLYGESRLSFPVETLALCATLVIGGYRIGLDKGTTDFTQSKVGSDEYDSTKILGGVCDDCKSIRSKALETLGPMREAAKYQFPTPTFAHR